MRVVLYFNHFSANFFSVFPPHAVHSFILPIHSSMKQAMACCFTAFALTYPLQSVLWMKSQALLFNRLCNLSFDLISHVEGGVPWTLWTGTLWVITPAQE